MASVELRNKAELTVITGTENVYIQEAGSPYTVKRALFATIRTWLKTYFDTLYTNIPIGVIMDWAGVSTPTNWLICDGSSLLRSSYPDLTTSLITSKGECTISNATPAVVTCNGHLLETGDRIHFTTTGALPASLAVSTNYYVIYIDVNTFWLASSYDNAVAATKINTSDAGSGVHTLYWSPWGIADATHLNLPDLRGVSTEGSGQQGYAAWASAEYAGRLGHYKQDKMQGHYHPPLASTGFVRYGSALTNGLAAGSDVAASTGGGCASTGAPMTDGSDGTPRTGASTRTPRVGLFKIIRVL